MSDFNEIKNRISLLGRAEYRYDLLVSHFAENYLALVEAKYTPLPDIEVFRTWLKHLNASIRPSLLSAWQEMARRFGFKMGDQISVGGTQLYVIRMSCYPLESIARLEGCGVKKDGKMSQTPVAVELAEASVVQLGGKSIEEAVLKPLFFEGTSRLANVREFLQSEMARLT